MTKKEKYRQLVTYLKTGEQVDLLNLGFGELKELLKDTNKPETWSEYELPFLQDVKEVFQSLNDRFDSNQEVIKELKKALLSSYFTPPVLVKEVIDAIPISTVKSFIDPAAGSGNFIKEAISKFPEANITGVEKEAISYSALRNNFPKVRAIHNGLENLSADHNGKYDLVVSNIPFGDIAVYDGAFYSSKNPVKINSTTRIHNYFVVKGIDLLTPDGILVYITSSAFADTRANEQFRRYMVENCKLLGHIRLPEHVFSETGTKASTDLIIVQKAGQKKSMTLWENAFIETREVVLDQTKVFLNTAIAEGFSAVHGNLKAGGQYGNKNAICQSDDEIKVIANRVGGYVSKCFDGIEVQNQSGPVASQESSLGIVVPFNPKLKNLITGNLFVFEQKPGRVTVEGEKIEFEPLKGLPVEKVGQIVNLREVYKSLLQSELDTNQRRDDLRAELNLAYDMYRFSYGPLNGRENRKILDFEAEDFKLLSLETVSDGQFIKADIFTSSTIIKEAAEEKPKTEFDSLLYSVRKTNRVDIDLMATMLTKEAHEVLQVCLSQELIFIERAKIDGSPYTLVTKDEYLSGNIVEKLEWMESSFPEEFDSFRFNHRKRLEEVSPAVLPVEIIDINLGERWLPADLYNDFVSDYFEVPTKAFYLRGLDSYEIEVSRYSEVDEITMAVNAESGRYKAHKLMEHAFVDTSPSFTMATGDYTPDGKEIRVADDNANRLASERIEAMKDSFDKWLKQSEKWRSQVEAIYHRKFNSSVARTFHGDHVEPEGLQFFKPHEHQKRAVHMNLQNEGGLCDHKVGAGKSLVIAMTAMESRRLGLAKKPLILCMKANVAGIYDDFIKAYPKAKVLFPTESDFKPKNRKVLFSRIMNNDWDSIIITHDQFKLIPQSLNIQVKIVQEELTALEEDLSVMAENKKISKKSLKGLESRKNNLEVRLKVLEANIARDPDLLDFEKMGFDLLFVDESQKFKNLMYTTRHSQVSGLGDPKGSERAYNLLTAVRTIQDQKGGDRGVIFLSGTPISNSLVELYLIFKYLRPNELERLSIRSFDAWAKVYARKSTDYEFSITNEVKRKERYREFIKVPELVRFYREIADVVTGENLNLDVPAVKHLVHTIKPTPAQEMFISNLVAFCKTKDGTYLGRGSLSDSEKKAYMLLATNYAKKMSLDMRIIDPTLPFEEGCKLNICASKVAEHYRESNDYKGVQLVFCDLSTPGAGKSIEFNAYEELRRLLIERYGIKPGEIAFIHDADTRTQRSALFQKVNNGDIRVMMGSTEKMGVGTNVQKRVIAMHDLDLPWRPSDLEQRHGRGGRQGNLMAKKYGNNEVPTYVYATERSLDSYQFNLLANKQKFINQMKKGSVTQRRLDEGGMAGEGNEQSMNFAEFVAELSGNKLLLERVKLDRKIKDLEGQYMANVAEFSYSERMIKMLNNQVKHDHEIIGKLKGDLQLYNEFISNPDPIKPTEKRYHYPKPVIIDGEKIYDSKFVGAKLIAKRQAVEELRRDAAGPVDLATYGPFRVVSGSFQQTFVVGPSNRAYSFSEGRLNENPTIAGGYIKNAIEKIPDLTGNYKFSIGEDQKKIEGYEKKLSVFFDTSELEKLKAELKKIDKELDIENEKEKADEKKRTSPESSAEGTIDKLVVKKASSLQV